MPSRETHSLFIRSASAPAALCALTVGVCLFSSSPIPCSSRTYSFAKDDYFVKSAGLRANRRAFGRGLLTSDGTLWQRQRQIMQPAFRVSNLDNYWPWLDAAMQRVLASWGKFGTRDIHSEMTDLCFEVLAMPLFGEDMSEVRALVIEAAAALHDFHQSFSRGVAVGGLAVSAMRAMSTLLGRPDFFFDPSLLPTKYAKQLRLAVAWRDRFVYEFIDRRAGGPLRQDLTSLLLSARDANGASLSHHQIRDEIVTMFFAGHETGAASISWTLYLLAKHPDIAARLASEPEGSPFIHKVLHESLRLFPPAYRVSRTVLKSCQLGWMVVPGGSRDCDSAVGRASLSAKFRRARTHFDPIAGRPT